jgi:sensor histidine kinase regulating citrate/malate metabolism
MDELRFSDVKEKALEENYHNLSQIMEENQENMHDLKHHVQALKLFSEHDDIDGIRGYLEKMGESVFKTDQLAWTDSKILNTILNQKQEECKKLGIHMDIHVGHSFQLPLDSREICTVFCNLLDNATEACERIDADKRWIHVELRRQGEMAFIIVENSISETPKIKNGRLVSSKADEKAHGIGLRSVKRTVKRHGGEMQIEIMEDMFRISLTFFEM